MEAAKQEYECDETVWRDIAGHIGCNGMDPERKRERGRLSSRKWGYRHS